MADKIPKSVITCDLEGRIQTFNEGAAALFGYSPEEVIGKKRVSLFSPGLVVLGHVGTWLKEAREKGEFHTRTVFLRKDKTPFAAEIRITPTFKHGEQIGYCGVTVPLPGVSPEEVMPKISLGTRLFSWMVITRAPFLTATLVPVLLAAAWVFARGAGEPFPWGLFGLVLLGACALHIAANTFNDYFDWKSGTDPENTEYFLPYSGGSRSIELGLISLRGLFAVALISLGVAAAVGVVLLWVRGPAILWFGLAGAFSAYFYTAPPLRLSARRGLGELFVGLNFGPLMVAGAVFSLSGSLSPWDFFVGLPVGLLTAAILYINEFPDAASDEKTGKNHLVVTLGKEKARWGYLALLGAAYGVVVLGAGLGILPVGAFLTFLSLPLAVYAARVLFVHFADRALVRANAATIQLQLVAGLLLALGLVL